MTKKKVADLIEERHLARDRDIVVDAEDVDRDHDVEAAHWAALTREQQDAELAASRTPEALAERVAAYQAHGGDARHAAKRGMAVDPAGFVRPPEWPPVPKVPPVVMLYEPAGVVPDRPLAGAPLRVGRQVDPAMVLAWNTGQSVADLIDAPRINGAKGGKAKAAGAESLVARDERWRALYREMPHGTAYLDAAEVIYKREIKTNPELAGPRTIRRVLAQP